MSEVPAQVAGSIYLRLCQKHGGGDTASPDLGWYCPPLVRRTPGGHIRPGRLRHLLANVRACAGCSGRRPWWVQRLRVRVLCFSRAGSTRVGSGRCYWLGLGCLHGPLAVLGTVRLYLI